MKTSIIIWTYNQLYYLQQCIASIRLYTASSTVEIIVIDDHSTDGTNEWLGKQPDILRIYNEEPKGYPAGCNQGLQLASGDNLLLLDNDVVVTQGWLDNLLHCLYSNEQIGAVAPVTNNSAYYQSVAVTYQNLQEMQAFARNYNRPNSQLWEERIKLVGCCMLIKRAAVEAAGELDENMEPGYLAEEDYSFRIRFCGYKLLFCRDTFIHHAGAEHFTNRPGGHYELLNQNLEKFGAKWGFNLTYSTWIRQDITGMLENPKTQAITVLEIGCACGATLLKIKSDYPQAKLYGIELNEQAALSAKLFADVIAADIEKTTLPYEEEYFDYVILADILEHLTDPWKALENIRPHLKAGGQILASIPNVMHFSVLRNLLQGNWTYEEAGILDKTHLRFFTLNEIKKLFTSTGYHVGSYRPNVIYESPGDQEFIRNLATISGNSLLQEQCRAYQYIIKARRPVGACPTFSAQRILDDRKICFVICEGDAANFRQCLSHIEGLEIPSGYEVEVMNVTNCVSMASAYNRAISQSNAKYKVYLHPDVCIIHKTLIQDMITIFANPKIGMLGVVGCSQLPANGIWWEAANKYGKVYDSHSGAMGLVAFQEIEQPYQEVQCVDGLLMITQYDFPWQQEIFAGWHFYDLAQCLECIHAGYSVVIPRQQQPWCIHNCGVVNVSNGYEDDRKSFVAAYL